MKRIGLVLLIFCLLLAGCASSQKANTVPITEGAAATAALGTEDTTLTDQAEDTRIIEPLPDTTMENLTDATLSVSFAEGDAYVDDTGKMQMDLKIYSYDQYGMVDIAGLKAGDTLVRHSGEMEVTSLDQDETGRVFINGGLDNGGFDLVTDDCGTFYEMGFNDSKNWHQVGQAVIRVSADFKGIDRADLELGEVIIYPGDFLIGAVTNFDFTPYNTTIRIENGQIVELNRRFIP